MYLLNWVTPLDFVPRWRNTLHIDNFFKMSINRFQENLKLFSRKSTQTKIKSFDLQAIVNDLILKMGSRHYLPGKKPDTPLITNKHTRITPWYETREVQGEWWIATFENKSNPLRVGDYPIGTLTSPSFRIKGSNIDFQLGVGCNAGKIRVEPLHRLSWQLPWSHAKKVPECSPIE